MSACFDDSWHVDNGDSYAVENGPGILVGAVALACDYLVTAVLDADCRTSLFFTSYIESNFSTQYQRK